MITTKEVEKRRRKKLFGIVNMITLEYGTSIIRLINTIAIKLKEVLVSLVNIIPYEYVTMVILPRETMTIT